MKKCLVISGGEFYAAPKDLLKTYDFVVACDKGYDWAKKLGVKPNLVIGDFDSCTEPPVSTAFANENSAKSLNSPNATEVIRLPSDKLDSDTLAGVKAAIELGFTDFTLICAAGGRFDHFFCNLQTLSYIAERFGKARMISKNEEIFVIKNTTIEIFRKEGWSLSVFSFCNESKGVSECGTRWSLNGAVMRQSEPYGLSNEWSAEKAKISVEDGTLIIILSKMNEKSA